MPDFLLPDLGEGLSEAEVVAWHVAPGDRVDVDQVIAEVETAKAVVEVPVPYAGVVTTLHAEPGAVLSVGDPLITVTADKSAEGDSAGFREPGVVVPEQASSPANGGGARSHANGGGARAGADSAAPAPARDNAARNTAAESPQDSGEEASGNVLIGYGTSATPARSRRGHRRGTSGAPPTGGEPPARPAQPATPPPGAPPPPAPMPAVIPPAKPVPMPAIVPPAKPVPMPAIVPPAKPVPMPAATPVATPASMPTAARPATRASEPHRPVAVVSPLVRKEAKDAGLDLTSLVGTGPEGVISRQDVRQAIAERATREQSALVTPVSGERRIPLRGARKAAADKLSRSRREIPEATVWVDVDATDLIETRRALNAADPARPVSLLALLARFAILGLHRYPELNARIEGDEIVVPGYIHLGFATQTDHGLVVPVVQDAHQLTTRDLSARLADRTAAARERRLTSADLAGGTFTVNNYGVFGVDGSAAIINHPEVAILGMGRVLDRPWVVNGELTVRKVTELTLAFDHRACDGGTAGGFLRYVADCLESPTTALGDM